MQDVKEYDGLIVVTPADFDRLSTMHDGGVPAGTPPLFYRFR